METRETCWLIEMIHNDAPIPRWWHPKEGWVWDAAKALRFSRQVDAEDFAPCMYGAGGKATEHVFLGSGLVASDPEILTALRKARQLVDIATDWNLDEVEIDGKMVPTHSLGAEFDAAISKATA